MHAHLTAPRAGPRAVPAPHEREPGADAGGARWTTASPRPSARRTRSTWPNGATVGTSRQITDRLRPLAIEAVRNVARLVIANERIGDLSKELKRAHRRIASLKASRSSATPSDRREPTNARDSARTPRRPVSPSCFARTPGPPSLAIPTSSRSEGRRRLRTRRRGGGGIADEEPRDRRDRRGAGREHATSAWRSRAATSWRSIRGRSGRRSRTGPRSQQFTGVRQRSLRLVPKLQFPVPRPPRRRARTVATRGSWSSTRQGLRPDIVYLDGDRRTDAVLRDITLSCRAVSRRR